MVVGDPSMTLHSGGQGRGAPQLGEEGGGSIESDANFENVYEWHKGNL